MYFLNPSSNFFKKSLDLGSVTADSQSMMTETETKTIDGLRGLLGNLDEWSRGVASDLFDSFRKWGKLTPKQWEFAAKLPSIADERLDKRYAELNALAALPETEAFHNGDRIKIAGKVLAAKWKESFYGEAFKILLEVSGGRKIWATGRPWMEKGDTLEGTITIKTTEDPTFYIGSRPHGWEKIGGGND